MAKGEEQTTRYASYLIRFRLVRNDDQPVWIASIDDTASGSHRSFPNVEALAAFLLAEFEGRRTGAEGGTQSGGTNCRLRLSRRCFYPDVLTCHQAYACTGSLSATGISA